MTAIRVPDPRGSEQLFDSVPNTYESIRRAVERFATSLASDSPDIESFGYLPERVVNGLKAAGVYRMGFPAKFGGPELTSAQQTHIIEIISGGDASTGWCAMVGLDAGMYHLSDRAVEEMFPTIDTVVAGMLLPAGRAQKYRDGYVLTGRWAMASGIHHADWISSGALLEDSDNQLIRDEHGKPVWRIFMTPPSDVRKIDTWTTTGLRGSGSIDYEIAGAFVPERFTFSLFEPTQASGPRSAPDVLMRKMAGVPVGMARAALDYVREVARERVATATGQRWADNYRVQFALGECEMKFIAMRYAVYGTLDDRWDQLSDGLALSDLTLDQQVATALARTNAFRTAREIIRRLYDVMASSAIYEPSPMDRWLRDIETISQHVMAQDKVIQSCGAHLLGSDPEFPLVLGLRK